MAVRKTLIDVIDRGLNPHEAHNKLDKQGRLIDSRAVSAPPVIAAEAKKEPLVAAPLKEESTVITETSEDAKDKVEKAEVKPEVKPAVPVQPATKKQDKSPKPA